MCVCVCVCVQLSVLYSIMKETFQESMSKFLTAKASFNYFRDLLLQHSVQRPPFSVGLFALQVPWLLCVCVCVCVCV